MFGIAQGFPILISKPPYIQLQKNKGQLAQLYKSAGLETFIRTGDLYQLFYEKGCQLMSPKPSSASSLQISGCVPATARKRALTWRPKPTPNDY